MSDNGSDNSLDEEVWQKLMEPDPADLAWVRDRVRAGTARRQQVDGCGNNFYALCFLLYLIGGAADARLIWAAKYANFDCGCMIDANLLSMRRISLAEMRAELQLAARPAGGEDDTALLKGLEGVFGGNGKDDMEEELQDLEANLRGYFELDQPTTTSSSP